jgi:N-glycosylase/DNA lyase
MTTLLIQSAIERVCSELRSPSKNTGWSSMTEERLLFHLVACILGSRVSFELARSAAEEIEQGGLLRFPMQKYGFEGYQNELLRVLRQPLYRPGWPETGRRYRFPHTKASHIARTTWAIYRDHVSLRALLRSCGTGEQARQSLMQVAVGVGPKQASLFLRNIGFSDELAVLDRHVLHFMSMSGLIDQSADSVPSLHTYEVYEERLRSYASSWRCSLGQLDQAIWVVMRVYSREATQ